MKPPAKITLKKHWALRSKGTVGLRSFQTVVFWLVCYLQNSLDYFPKAVKAYLLWDLIRRSKDLLWMGPISWEQKCHRWLSFLFLVCPGDFLPVLWETHGDLWGHLNQGNLEYKVLSEQPPVSAPLHSFFSWELEQWVFQLLWKQKTWQWNITSSLTENFGLCLMADDCNWEEKRSVTSLNIWSQEAQMHLFNA